MCTDNSGDVKVHCCTVELDYTGILATDMYIISIHDIQLVSQPGGASSEVLNIPVQCMYHA